MEKFKVLTATLAGGVNQHEFTDLIINNDSVIEVYTTDDNIYPTDIYQQGNTVYVTLVDHSDIIGVCVTVNNVTSFSQPMYAADIIYNLINPEYTVYDAISSVEDEIRHIPDYYVGFDRYDEDQETINNKFDTLDEDLVGLTTAVNNIADDVSDIQGDISGIQGEVTSVKESLTQYEQIVDSAIDGGYLQNKNLLTFNNATENYYANANTKAIVGSVDYIATDYIKVKGTSIVVSGFTMGYAGGPVGMIGYDSNKNAIISSNRATMDISNCSYIRLSVGKADKNTFQIEYGTQATSHVDYIPSNTELNKSLQQISDISTPTIDVTSNVTSGSITCIKMGRLVIIRFWNVIFAQANTNIPVTGQLPSIVSEDERREANVLRSASDHMALAFIGAGNTILVNADSASASYYGELIYIADN